MVWRTRLADNWTEVVDISNLGTLNTKMAFVHVYDFWNIRYFASKLATFHRARQKTFAKMAARCYTSIPLPILFYRNSIRFAV